MIWQSKTRISYAHEFKRGGRSFRSVQTETSELGCSDSC